MLFNFNVSVFRRMLLQDIVFRLRLGNVHITFQLWLVNQDLILANGAGGVKVFQVAWK